MARERYLVGVSEEELRPDPPRQTAPQTPRSWLENFWYHHKVAVMIGAVLVALAGVLIYDAITRVKPDYTMLLATEGGYPAEEITYFERVLEYYGEDVNGDGKVVVEIGSATLGGVQMATQGAGSQKLQAQLITGDTLVYIFEPKYAPRLTAVGRDNAHCFLTELPLTAEGMSEDKLYWNWKADKRRAEDEYLKLFPEELCFGVRYAKPDDEASAAAYERCVKLLEAFATDTPLTSKNK